MSSVITLCRISIRLPATSPSKHSLQADLSICHCLNHTCRLPHKHTLQRLKQRGTLPMGTMYTSATTSATTRAHIGMSVGHSSTHTHEKTKVTACAAVSPHCPAEPARAYSPNMQPYLGRARQPCERTTRDEAGNLPPLRD